MRESKEDKLRRVSELAGQTAKSVTRSADAWKRYLSTAARIYKYEFDDQLLIYAQRPDATACAEITLWNNAMRRRIAAGTKGIALIHKDGAGKPYFRHVFDVSDTRPAEGARLPYLWELRKEHHTAVREALEQRFGPSAETEIGQMLMEQASRAVNAAYSDHLKELRYHAPGSLLEELDDLNLAVRFRDLLTASVQYAVLTRCGLEPGQYLGEDDLSSITEFSTSAVLHHLGDAASAVTKEFLMEIGSAVKRIEREKILRSTSEKPLAKQQEME